MPLLRLAQISHTAVYITTAYREQVTCANDTCRRCSQKDTLRLAPFPLPSPGVEFPISHFLTTKMMFQFFRLIHGDKTLTSSLTCVSLRIDVNSRSTYNLAFSLSSYAQKIICIYTIRSFLKIILHFGLTTDSTDYQWTCSVSDASSLFFLVLQLS